MNLIIFIQYYLYINFFENLIFIDLNFINCSKNFNFKQYILLNLIK